MSEKLWLTLGFIAQACFFLRFVFQWIATERRKESHIPEIFWYLSLAGAVGLLFYAIHRKDPVFIAGPALSFLVYARNLHFIHKKKNASTDLT